MVKKQRQFDIGFLRLATISNKPVNTQNRPMAITKSYYNITVPTILTSFNNNLDKLVKLRGIVANIK